MFESIKGLFLETTMLARTIPILRRVKSNPEKYSDDYTYSIMKKFIDKSLKGINQEVIIYGKENIPKENALFVGNHKSMLDGFIMPSVVNKPIGMIIAKEPLHENLPIATDWMKINRCLFMDRKNNREAIKTINEAVSIIENYRSVGAFPEGDITPDGIDIDEFKDGLFKIALKANCPVVPIVIKGSEDSYKYRKNFLPKITKSRIEVYILNPITIHIDSDRKVSTKELSKETRDIMLKKIREK